MRSSFYRRVLTIPSSKRYLTFDFYFCSEPSTPDRDGRWSPWSTWSECSAKCDGGYRFRTRKCDSPPPQVPGGLDCQGCNVDYEICNEIPCPEVKRLSSWTPWQGSQNGSEKRFRFSCKAPVNDPLSIKIALSKEEERICQHDGSCYRTGEAVIFVIGSFFQSNRKCFQYDCIV